MRGSDERSGALFSYVDLEARVPPGHPLRTIRAMVNEALAGLSPGLHDLYARIGRPSIPPEQLLRALLLQTFYAIRPDRHGERRANDSHASTTDPDARLYRKGPGQEAKLCFVGHVLMENRHGLVVDAELTRASGHAERRAALAMLDRLPTVGPMNSLPTAASTPETS